MSKNREFVYRLIIVMATVLLVFTLVQSPSLSKAAPLVAGAPMLHVNVFEVPSTTYYDSFNTTPVKLADLGTVTVSSADSLLEITYNGGIYVGFMSGSYVFLEIRVDNTSSTVGRARTQVQASEIDSRVPVSFTGFFSGLVTGNHIISIWVWTSSGQANTVQLNGFDLPSDVLIVKEYQPFGFSYLPLTTK